MAAIVETHTGRRRVLDAAAELFVAQGYAGTTLRQIASAAGIKAGSIYHHFDSKDALFVAVLEDGIAVMIEAFDKAESGLDPAATEAEQMRTHVRSHLSAVFENGPYTTAHVTSFFSAPETVRSQVVPHRDSYEQQWNDLFQRLYPELPARTRRFHRLFLFGTMNATTEWFDPKGNVSLNKLASTITDQFLYGVKGMTS
jgi:AcrR family transcriptional regulator